MGRTAIGVTFKWLLTTGTLVGMHASLRRTQSDLRLLARIQLLGKMSVSILRERLQRQLPPEGRRPLWLDVKRRARKQLQRRLLYFRTWIRDAARAMRFERSSRIEDRRRTREARVTSQSQAKNDAPVYYGPVYL